MRRPVLLLLVPLVLLAVGCSSSRPYDHKVTTPVPSSYDGSAKTQTTAAIPAVYKNGDPAAGKAVFASAGCAGCHTLKDANASGTVGPNLDDLKPPLSRVVPQVINGGASMPPFKGTLSDKQIADVAAYVVKATGGSPTG